MKKSHPVDRILKRVPAPCEDARSATDPHDPAFGQKAPAADEPAVTDPHDPDFGQESPETKEPAVADPQASDAEQKPSAGKSSGLFGGLFRSRKRNESPSLRRARRLFSFREHAPVALSMIIIMILWFIPTGFEGRLLYQGSDKTTAKVLTVNNDQIHENGLLKVGEQTAEVKLLGGRFKGRKVDAFNHLNGSLAQDKIFKPGETARVVIDFTGDHVIAVNLIDHDRIPQETILSAIFLVLLLIVAGKTGFHSLLSFIMTILAMWKILVPQILDGANPVVLSLVIITILTILIISPVFGYGLRSAAAIGGSLLGTLATFILSLISTKVFLIHGAVMAQSESLIYSGFEHLDLTQIFMATVYIGASGALMDLAVDITSAVSEVVSKKQDISWVEAFRSASNVGKAAMGTMTTTLLLAYSGGYLVLMMIFMAQGTPLMNILNYKEVAAEIIHTLVGSIGLVTVVPFTAFLAAFFLTRPAGVKEIAEALAFEE